MTEATRTEEQEREALIQEMLRDSKAEQIPDEFTNSPVLHKGDETLEAPMVVKEISSAGYVYVWDTRTYEKVPILYYMLPAKMRQRRDDGSFRFTTNKPKELPWRGSLKCFLHKDDSNRKHYDDLGFRYCSKSNLTNPYQRERHMQLKHSKEWASIESEKKEQERMEDRALQQAILGKVTEIKQEEPKETAPLYVSDKPPKLKRGRKPKK